MIGPPPRPWKIRAMIRVVRLGAAPDRNELTTKSVVQRRKKRLRPRRPASHPVAGITTALAARYDVMTHETSSSPADSEPCRCGRMTLVTLVSRICMKATTLTVKVMAHFCVGETEGASGAGVEAVMIQRSWCDRIARRHPQEGPMKAAVFHGAHKPLTIEQVEIDRPLGREVLVRTVASGVCHSDLHFVDGFYPFPTPAILGHEAAGIVEAVGPHVSEFKAGDHVIACLSVFCGACDYCLTGKTHLCQSRPVRKKDEPPKLTWNGQPVNQFANLSAYAEKMLVHENALVKIDDQMPFAQAALIGCGVTTGVGAVLNTARIEPGSTVAVFGAGGVGLAAIQGARIAGARTIIAVDTVESKLAKARELGATHTGNAETGDPVKAIRTLTGGGVDYSFEAIGLKVAAEQCFDCIRPGGTATIIGMIPVGQKIELDGPMFLREKKIQGCSMGSNRFKVDMPRYIEFYRQGRLKLDEMVSRRGRLEDVNEAFRAMKAGEVARTVLMFD